MKAKSSLHLERLVSMPARIDDDPRAAPPKGKASRVGKRPFGDLEDNTTRAFAGAA